MATLTKKQKEARAKIDKTKLYALSEATALVKEITNSNFDASVDIAVRLGVDPRKANQMVRGVVTLPHGTGKDVKVLALVTPDKEAEAKEAGADYVGLDEYLEKIKNGWTDVDVIITMPSVMGKLGPLGRVLGPRGLMPNPKTGTVTMDVAKAVAEVKAGKIDFKVDKTGIVHAGIGKVSFSAAQLADNAKELIDTLIKLNPRDIPGIYDLPDYQQTSGGKKMDSTKMRAVSYAGVYWSPSGKQAMIEVRAQDNKDRWLLSWDTAFKKFDVANRQRDEAWIGGPGIPGWGGNSAGWIDADNFWYRSESSGYAHLYRYQASTRQNIALTSGNYEVQQAQLSNDRKFFFLTSNEVHSGEQQFYKLRISDGQKTRLTQGEGAHQVTLSPDEKKLATLFSSYNRPWELYLQINEPGVSAQAITGLARSDEFNRYNWRIPELIQIPARDGAKIQARLYKPANPHSTKPAVIFVHGAGYLQNAHKWWSSYFREYMFHNLLTDLGYHVLDIDYRGSAGYGRDWRTGIYRYMGGKDLTDHVDATKLLVDLYGVDPSRIGIYGGSYGGFITLMALFTTPDVFKAGAALRPVTDWANYNHGYTSNILNEPAQDSLAYKRSSPIYFAGGLKNHLLICHGMLDLNVHYQDAVKLTQRLIELGKDHWELASYPMEDHGFVEPSSWTDEYKRILQLFERVLKAPLPVKP